MSLVGRGNLKAGKKRRLVLGPPWQAPKLGRLPKGRLAPLAAAGALAVRGTGIRVANSDSDPRSWAGPEPRLWEPRRASAARGGVPSFGSS
jgi:hypothetical protein